MAERSRWAPGAATLAEASRVVSSVAFDGRSSEEALGPYDEAPQRAAIMAIALGSLRWYLRLWPAVEGLLSRPQAVANEIRALLIVSAHQIEYSRNVPEATVHAAVDATRILRQGSASGFVNAVLRRFVAHRTTILERVDRTLAARTAHPAWLVKLLEQAWPELHPSILAANNQHPPLVLRVDLSRKSRASYLEDLASAEIAAKPVEWAPTAVRLNHPVSVPHLPGFREGLVSVQDAGAQLAAQLLDARPGMRVLDACAAPGGKTGHLLEHTAGLSQVWAIDVDSERVSRIHENLDRLGRKARVEVADVREPSTFWDGRPFERILVDAPCSSTGVIRRHPDIKLLRRRSDIPAFVALQEQILRAAFGLLAPGGRLVYCTCSLLSEENEEVVGRLLSTDPAASVATMPLLASLVPGAVAKKVGIQLIPGSQAGTDGFYYACLEKTTVGT